MAQAKKTKVTQPQKVQRNKLEYRPGISDWFSTTQTLFNRLVAFYFDVIQAHELILDMTNKEALTTLEKLTHQTKHNLYPVMPDTQIAVQVPAYFRRAAINAALGTARSFYSNLAHWKKGKAKAEAKGKRHTHRPPVPPRIWNRSVTFYAGMWGQRESGRITLKLWDGQTWRWVRFRLLGQELPAEWTANSPQVVRKGNYWWLHTPLEKPAPRIKKAQEQAKTNPDLRICAVDLNINDALAVCTIQQVNGTVVATRFIKGGSELHDRRKRLLGRIAHNRSRTGLIALGEPDNAALWRKINALDEQEAHRVSRRIVEFARQYGATILVFEHLGHFKPLRGRYSKRANEKRTYWLRGRIFNYSRYKAWEHGLLTCRVNPRNTSRLCGRRVSRLLEQRTGLIPLCGGRVFRYQAGEAPLAYRPGAPLILCPECGGKDQADRNATKVIGFKFFERYLTEKPQSEGIAIAVKAEGGGDLLENFTQVKAGNGCRLPAEPERHEVSTGPGTAPVVENGQVLSIIEGQVLATTVSLAKMHSGSSGHVADALGEVYAGVPEEAAPL